MVKYLLIAASTLNVKRLNSKLPRPAEGERPIGIFSRPVGYAADLDALHQLQSLYLTHRLRENTIGAFLAQHVGLLKRYFNSDHVLCEPSFDWVEFGTTKPDKASIRPDVMVRNSNGFYDIVDLKTALLEKKTITNSDDARRTFINYVYQGQAQLANYARYFTFEKNQAHALERHRVKVHKPSLTLIVGHMENADPESVSQAQMCSSIQIVDYDSFFSQLYALCQ